MTGFPIAGRALAFAAVVALAAPAFAQDYTVTTQSTKYTAPPASGVTTESITGDDSAGSVDLPFNFPYFGKSYSTSSVCTNGFMQLGSGSARTYSNQSLPRSGAEDVMIAPLWDDLIVTGNGAIKTWTSGTAPNRVFFVSWEGVPYLGSQSNPMTFQVQLFETTGRIIFAYGPQTTWVTSGYTVGIDAESPDTRYVNPTGYTGNNNSGKPPDFQFDPTITNITGNVLIDQIVSDSSGIGNSVVANVPPTGLRIELRSSGDTVGTGIVDEDGDFTIRGVALVSADTGDAHLVAASAAGDVSPSTSAAAEDLAPPHSIEIADGIDFDGDSVLDDAVVGESADSGGAVRGALQIAMHLAKVQTWVEARTEDSVPYINVLWDNNQSAATRYQQPTDVVNGYLRVGGSASGNQDAFDASRVTRVYGRYVLENINGIITSRFQDDLDSAAADTENAFAEGFGLYLHALIEGTSEAIDGTSSSAADVFDLETPDLSSAPAPGIPGWAAAALFDLTDAANEVHDGINGTGGTDAERAFRVVDALTDGATPTNFLDEWDNQGFDAASLVQNFIRHGLLEDDAAEPNDSADTATVLGQAGVRSSGNILNRFNEDWFEVLVPAPTDAFLVELTFNRFAIDAEVILEVRSPAGAILATGIPQGSIGPILATTGPTGPGPVHVRIAHVSGDTITDYTVQAFSRIAVSTSGVPEWTVRRTINQPLVITGGIPPFSLSLKPGSSLPRGMLLDAPNARLIGSPLDEGNFTFTISATDSGDPSHGGTVTQNFKINAPLTFSAPAFTGVALNRETDVNLGRTGGTNPITLENFVGNLPGGLALTEDFHILGTAAQPGGGDISFTATDLAGSAANVDTTLVVCTPIEGKNEELELAAGSSAAGFYFDALAGGSVSLKLKTAKKRAKRDLEFLVLSPDGNTVAIDPSNVKVKAGKITLKNVLTPISGRYFVAFSSTDGGEATQLLGTMKSKLPKKGGGAFTRMTLDEQYTFEFGALAGASFTLKGKTTEGMEIRVLFIVQPDGSPFTDFTVVNKKGKVTITVNGLTQDGTHTVFLVPEKADFADLNYKFKLKQPKGGVFSVD